MYKGKTQMGGPRKRGTFQTRRRLMQRSEVAFAGTSRAWVILVLMHRRVDLGTLTCASFYKKSKSTPWVVRDIVRPTPLRQLDRLAGQVLFCM